MEPAKPYLQFTVAFDEADQEGIVFFGNYFRLAHRALEHWLPLQGVPWKEWFQHPDYGVPLRHVEADYLAPLRPGDTFEATVRVVEIKDSSIRFEYEFRHQGRVGARLTTVHVFVARSSRQKIAVPGVIREKLKAIPAEP